MLYTIGHSSHSLESFIGLLKHHSIRCVCDVRSIPSSRYYPQFNKAELRRNLAHHGIEYRFLGDQLGGRSKLGSVGDDAKVNYRRLARDTEFQKGLDKLVELADNGRPVMMCAEKDPITCHRMILICRELRSAKIEIYHILADGVAETNDHAEERLLQTLKIQPSFLVPIEEQIQEAYDTQANRIAYVHPTAEESIAGKRLT